MSGVIMWLCTIDDRRDAKPALPCVINMTLGPREYFIFIPKVLTEKRVFNYRRWKRSILARFFDLHETDLTRNTRKLVDYHDSLKLAFSSSLSRSLSKLSSETIYFSCVRFLSSNWNERNGIKKVTIFGRYIAS